MKKFFPIFLWLLTTLPLFGNREDVHITRAPYLQAMSAHAVLIAWRTNKATTGEIAVEMSGVQESLKRLLQENRMTTIHAVWLRNLRENTLYEYKILGENHALTPWITFKTFPEPGDAPFSFAVLGDSGTASFYQKAVAKQLAQAHPDLVLHTGDVIYDPKSDYDFDAKFFQIYWSLAEQVPFFPSLGNHDVAFENGDPYLRNFYVPQNSPGHGRYYSFTCGNAHFVALNSNEAVSPGSRQYEWLSQDLEHSSLPITIVYFHHPLYSSGYHGSSFSLRKSLVPLFERFHVTLVFNGHDHDYERSISIHGITYIVSGGGGAILYSPEHESWTAVSRAIFHFVLCRVKGREIHLKAVSDAGNVFDTANFTVGENNP